MGYCHPSWSCKGKLLFIWYCIGLYLCNYNICIMYICILKKMYTCIYIYICVWGTRMYIIYCDMCLFVEYILWPNMFSVFVCMCVCDLYMHIIYQLFGTRHKPRYASTCQIPFCFSPICYGVLRVWDPKSSHIFLSSAPPWTFENHGDGWNNCIRWGYR